MNHDYTSETLYYKAPSGTIRTWYVVVSGCYYATITGEAGREGNQSAWTEVSGKNLNRSNELSPENAALAKAKSMIADKLASGYVDSMSKLEEQSKIPRCMLAVSKLDIKKIKSDIDAGRVFIQNKFDGYRCLASINGMFTRNMRKIMTCKHIEKALKPVFDEHPSLIIDGELYSHSLSANFEKLQSLVTKESDLLSTLENERLIEYHVYDFVDNLPFKKRYLNGRKKLTDIKHIVMAKTVRVQSEDYITQFHSKSVANGFEGSMLRISKLPYQGNKRSSQLIKIKDFLEEEITVIAVNEGKGAWSGYAKSISCIDKDGREFDAGCSGNQALLSDVLLNSNLYIDRKATIKFFSKFNSGVPRFPICIKFYPVGIYK